MEMRIVFGAFPFSLILSLIAVSAGTRCDAESAAMWRASRAFRRPPQMRRAPRDVPLSLA